MNVLCLFCSEAVKNSSSVELSGLLKRLDEKDAFVTEICVDDIKSEAGGNVICYTFSVILRMMCNNDVLYIIHEEERSVFDNLMFSVLTGLGIDVREISVSADAGAKDRESHE